MTRITPRRPWLPLGLALALLAPVAEESQAQEPYPRDTLLSAAREVVESARYCALITLDEAGAPQARTMDPFLPDEGWSVWLGTNRASRKVAEIRRDPRVTLYWYSTELAGYVSLTGRARLVDDAEEKRVRWKDEWAEFYPDRESYLLIEVTPERLEVVNYGRGITSRSPTWEAPSVVFPGGPG